MIINLLLQNPVSGIVLLLAIALAIGIHEAAHAWAADKLGDDTAKSLGRTSINPLVHLDLVGTLLLLFAGFGWGKPVPVNENRLRKRSDIILVALAGPASNLVIAIILALVFRLIGSSSIQEVLALFIFMNLGLMVFNLIPIPPLDGSKVLKLFISDDAYQMLEQYGFMFIIILFFVLRFGQFGLGDLLVRAVDWLFVLLTGAMLGF